MDNGLLAALAIERALKLTGAWDDQVPKTIGYKSAKDWTTPSNKVVIEFNELRAATQPPRLPVVIKSVVRSGLRAKPLRDFHTALRETGDGVDAGTIKPARCKAATLVEVL